MINYIDLIKRAWEITWKNRFLWIFGLFLGGTSIGISNLNFNFGSQDLSNYQLDRVSRYLEDYLTRYWSIILIVMISLFFIWIAWWIASIISEGALIGSVADIHQDKKHRFTSAFKIGLQNFWRILGLGIMVGFGIILLIILFIIPTILLFIAQSFILGIVWLIMVIFLLMIIGVIIGFLVSITQRYLVLENQGIFKSLFSAWQIIRKNLKEMFFFLISTWVINIIIGIALFVVILLLLSIFAVIGLVIYTLSVKTVLIVYISFALLIIFVVSYFIHAVLQTFFSAYWTLFWLKIRA